jgi:large subunit ribosomal protein L17
MVNRKLGRTSAHRNAMFRNQLASLIDKERIITTLPKAKELRPQIERLITLAKNKDDVHGRRQAGRIIADDKLVAKLFGTLAPRFSERPGGYTRIVKLGSRRGDAAEMAILEFVDFELKTESAAAPEPAKKAKAKKAEPEADADETPKKRARKAAPKAEAEPAAEEKPKKPRKKKSEE